MENGLLTVNGKPIHCVGMKRENFSEFFFKGMVDYLVWKQIGKEAELKPEPK